MPAPHPSPSGTAGNIVLVEEYSALAVALASAITKFAPDHAVRTARNLAEAETLAATANPRLFVIDFDPPLAGALDFFSRLKVAHADARALVLAPGQWAALMALRSAPALSFLEKPFDLAQFGAAVRGLIDGRTSHNTAAGRMSDLAVADIVLLCCAGESSIQLKIEAAGRNDGLVVFQHGQIVHAATLDATGADALTQMLRWRAPRFREAPLPDAVGKTIRSQWPALLRKAFEESAPEVPAPSAAARAAGNPGRRLVVVDDTETLLIFVEDVLVTADPTLLIHAAANAGTGVNLIRSLKPDLVLLDYSLPDRNGEEICGDLLQDPETQNIPVVMMSGHVQEMMSAAGRCENIVATIAKPFLSTHLVEVVQSAFDKPVRPRLASPRTEELPPQPVVERMPERPDAAEASAAAPAESATPVSEIEPEVSVAPQPPAAAAEEPETAPVITTPDAEAATSGDIPETTPSEPAPDIPAPAAPPAPPPIAPPAPVSRPVTLAESDYALEQIAAAAAAVAPPIPAIRPARALSEPIDSVISVGLPPGAAKDVVLTLPMEVFSIQVTPSLRVGALKLRPPTHIACMHVRSATMQGAVAPDTSFELGRADVTAHGQLEMLRLRPTAHVSGVPRRTAFRIGALELQAAAAGAFELKAAQNGRMTVELVAGFELASVELSPTFQVSQFALRSRGAHVRIRLRPDADDETGTLFEIVGIQLDASSRIAELTLHSAAPVPAGGFRN